MVKPKALIVVPSFQSFILQDIQILSSRYELVINQYDWKKKELAPLYLIFQFFHLLFSIGECRFVLVHFGGYWSFLPTLFGKIFGKPTYIILHGTDCASIPELNYGSLRIPLLKWFCKKSYEWATLLLPVSESLVRTSSDFYRQQSPLPNGFAHHFPTIRTPYQVIANGFDTQYWHISPELKKEGKSFIAVLSEEQYILKGADLIIELARRFPDCHFKIAGMQKPEGLNGQLSNLVFLGKITRERLLQEFQKSTFYFQLSVFEGFGCALCEAMLCGCIPVVSAVNELPTIVGNHGHVLYKRDINLLEKMLRKIMGNEATLEERQAIRERIIERYSLQNRKNQLFSVLPH